MIYFVLLEIMNIMTKQEEKAIRRKQIIDLLLERPYMQVELMDTLGISKKTLQDDIKYLNEHGYNIPKHSKHLGYVIKDAEKERIRILMAQNGGQPTVYQSLVSNHIQKTILLLILQKKGRFTSLAELTDEYEDYLNKTGGEEQLRERLINSINNTLGETGVGLVAEGFVEQKRLSELNKNDSMNIPQKYKNEKDIKCYRVTKKSPVLLTLDWDSAQDILMEIRAFGSAYSLKKKLKDIEAKLSVALYNEVEMSQDNSFVVYGNRINRNAEIEKELDYLKSIPFEKNVIKIIYNENEILFKTGMLVYVADKDKLYMMGKNIGAPEEYIDSIIVLRVDRMKDVVTTNDINDIYLSNEFTDIYEDMFSISAEPIEHVEVEFDIFGNVPKKLEQLANKRKCAHITYDYEKNVGLYVDEIRGIEDFAKYLRRYGRSIRVIKPEILKEKMRRSLDRLEERYRAEGLYE